jgi:hypothetical protein
VANKVARIAWAIMAKGGTIERRSPLQPLEEAAGRDRVAALGYKRSLALDEPVAELGVAYPLA